MAKTAYEVVKEWRKENPEKVAAQARRRRARNPEPFREASRKHRAAHLAEIRVKDAEAKRKSRANDPEAQRERIRRFKEREEAKRVSLAGRPRADHCELCGTAGRTVWDHCHESGHFRGWICDRCNRVLGSVNDSETVLLAMVEYLKESRRVEVA